MGNQLALLKMLMPVVRPDGVAPLNPSSKLPLEEQSFEQMLMDLQTTDAPEDQSSAEPTLEESESSPMRMIKQLGGMDRIENPDLRQMLSQGMEPRQMDGL